MGINHITDDIRRPIAVCIIRYSGIPDYTPLVILIRNLLKKLFNPVLKIRIEIDIIMNQQYRLTFALNN